MIKNKRPDAPGDCGNFMIRVQCTQNATWQGSVQWMEGGKRQNFRSALELINLMEEALASVGHDAIRRWDEADDEDQA